MVEDLLGCLVDDHHSTSSERIEKRAVFLVEVYLGNLPAANPPGSVVYNFCLRSVERQVIGLSVTDRAGAILTTVD
jgi:hypothetical protein